MNFKGSRGILVETFTPKIFDCSPDAASRIESYKDTKGAGGSGRGPKGRPWTQLEIGKCWTEPFPEKMDDFLLLEKKLKFLAYERGRWYGKKFIVFKHPMYKVFEIARIG